MKILICILFLSGCVSNEIKNTSSITSAKTVRYLAWFEGDLQNEYKPSRDLALKKIKVWESEPPEISDTEKYLSYLALLDLSRQDDEALKKIKDYLQKNPKELRGEFLLAVHYMRRGKDELANYFFTKLEKKHSFQWKSLLYNNIGLMAYKAKNYNEAVLYFEKAIGSFPPIAAPFVNLGAIYLRGRNYEKALQMFQKAVSIDPNFEDAVLGMGVSLTGLKRYEEANNIYGEYIERNPEGVSVLYNKALVLGDNLKRSKEASEVMLQYIQKGGRQAVRAQKFMEDWK